MMTRKTLLFLFLVVSLSVAQRKNFTTKDIVFNSYFSLAPSRLNSLQWILNGNDLSFVERKDKKFILKKVDFKTGKRVSLISLEKLNESLAKKGIPQLKYFPRIKWIKPGLFRFVDDTLLVYFNVKNRAATIVARMLKGYENLQVAPNNKFVGFTIKNNLFIYVNGKIIQITNDKNPAIVNGHTVHRVEFGINKGIFWSPRNNFVAFYRKDETMVTDYPVLNLFTRPATVKFVKYPMAGGKSHQVKLGVYSLKNGKTVFLKTGEPKDHYLTCVTWGPEEKFIYIAILNRDQNHLRLIKYNVSNGEPADTLFEETNPKYVHPMHPLVFVPNKPNLFLWRSERDGWDHIYLYNTSGRLIRKLTKGNWVVTDFLGFDISSQNIFFVSTKESPIQRHLYRLNIRTGKMSRLTKGNGVHKIILRKDGKYFVDRFNSLNVPGITSVVNSQGKYVVTLHKSSNPIKDYRTGKIKIFKIKTENNIDLYCRMVMPVDFDSTKKYPVIVYVYGGPGVQLILNSWPVGRYSFWFQKMAEEGFIVFTLDNRGSANRGLAFEQATFRHLGTVEISDQMRGVKYLKSLAYVDTNRLGVFGWSFGGFMTTSLMLRTNNTFKVGVAGGAVIDWKYYEVMYTERYMDTPQANPEGYKEANLLNYVQNLKGKLLLVHGTSDVTVVWQQTLLFAKKAADLNIPLDYYPYVGHKHGVVGIDAIHLYNKITNYFLDNL